MNFSPETPPPTFRARVTMNLKPCWSIISYHSKLYCWFQNVQNIFKKSNGYSEDVNRRRVNTMATTYDLQNTTQKQGSSNTNPPKNRLSSIDFDYKMYYIHKSTYKWVLATEKWSYKHFPWDYKWTYWRQDLFSSSFVDFVIELCTWRTIYYFCFVFHFIYIYITNSTKSRNKSILILLFW